jgi:hypothetical protein
LPFRLGITNEALLTRRAINNTRHQERRLKLMTSKAIQSPSEISDVLYTYRGAPLTCASGAVVGQCFVLFGVVFWWELSRFGGIKLLTQLFDLPCIRFAVVINQ